MLIIHTMNDSVLEPLEPLEPFFHYPPVFEKLWEYIVKGFQGFQIRLILTEFLNIGIRYFESF